MASGCQYSPPHPPGFDDFRRIGPGAVFDPDRVEAQLTVFEAARFLPSDIAALRRRGDARELVGALLQARVGDTNVPVVRQQARERAPQDLVVLAGIVLNLGQELANGISGTNAENEMAVTLATMETLDPSNGWPHAMRAWLQCRTGDTNGARDSVRLAVQKPALKCYGAELRQCVRKAALALNYPRYTASMVALGVPAEGMHLVPLGRGLLEGGGVDMGTANDLLELGKRLQRQSRLFIEELIALALQKRALEALNRPDLSGELQRIGQARAEIHKAVEFLNSPEVHQRSERQALKYFEDLWRSTEMEATRALAAEMNRKL